MSHAFRSRWHNAMSCFLRYFPSTPWLRITERCSSVRRTIPTGSANNHAPTIELSTGAPLRYLSNRRLQHQGIHCMTHDEHQRLIYETAYAGVEQRFAVPDPKILEGWKPPAGGLVLSVGAGAGRDLWHLTSELHVHAIDFATSGLRVGKAR